MIQIIEYSDNITENFDNGDFDYAHISVGKQEIYRLYINFIKEKAEAISDFFEEYMGCILEKQYDHIAIGMHDIDGVVDKLTTESIAINVEIFFYNVEVGSNLHLPRGSAKIFFRNCKVGFDVIFNFVNSHVNNIYFINCDIQEIAGRFAMFSHLNKLYLLKTDIKRFNLKLIEDMYKRGISVIMEKNDFTTFMQKLAHKSRMNNMYIVKSKYLDEDKCNIYNSNYYNRFKYAHSGEFLSLSGFNLHSIRPFKDTKDVVMLDLSNNLITELKNIKPQDYPNLKYIDLMNNKIKTIANADILRLPKIESINLSNNQIESLKDASGLDKIVFDRKVYIYLFRNPIRYIASNYFKTGVKLTLYNFQYTYRLVDDIFYLPKSSDFYVSITKQI